MTRVLIGPGHPIGPLDESEPRVLPPPPARIHFVGIGGVGMSGLARSLRAQGYTITGSDSTSSSQTEALVAIGIPVSIGHTAVEWATQADVMIVTRRAVQRSSPELEAAVAAEVPIIRRGELVGSLFNARRGIAVAGSHGKSTTTGMLVWALRAGQEEPSFAIGASIPQVDSTVVIGTGAAMVVEADEFDHQFLWLRPEVAVVTNVEFDHPDVFADQDAYDDDFRRFAQGTKPGGILILAADDPGSARVQRGMRLGTGVRLQRFGETDEADWRVSGTEGAWSVRMPDGRDMPLELSVPGRHNARNATAAVAALVALGWEADEAARGIASFPGVGRRFEVKGEIAGVVVVDDYAHHPTEVRATLQAARGRFPDRRLWAAFQPHTYSRTKALLDEFAEALGEADRVAVLDIYGATETDDLGISAVDLVERVGRDAEVVGDPPAAAERLAEAASPGDVVLTLGAGSVTTLGPALLARLAKREA